MSKSSVLKAAGIGCGDDCFCRSMLAETLTDGQVRTIAHMHERKLAGEAMELMGEAANLEVTEHSMNSDNESDHDRDDIEGKLFLLLNGFGPRSVFG